MGSGRKWGCSDSRDLSSLLSLLFSPAGAPGEAPTFLQGMDAALICLGGCQAMPTVWEQRSRCQPGGVREQHRGLLGAWKMGI